MALNLANPDSSVKRLDRLQALLQLDSGERRRELERIRRDDPRAGAALDDLLAHGDAARVDGLLPVTSSNGGPALAPGDRVGTYQIERLLGRGGMGAVYLARRSDPYKQAVALKRMHLGLPERLAARFDAERQILATLVHPGIVRQFDGGAGPDGSPYLVMEYIDGSRLDDHCLDRDATPEERVRLVHAVAEALAYAHRQGIVHRDLKPSNVLVDIDGQPHVTDFGLAKLVATTEEADATETNWLLGTPMYMAPERFTLGPGRNEPGVDVYSLGVILFLLLARRLPFESEEVVDGCARAVREDAPLLRSLVPSIPRDLETIAARALARDPADRFKDAGEMAEQLRRFLAGELLTIRPPTPAERVARWAARRRRALLAWGASFALALVAMIGMQAVWNRQLQRERDGLRGTMRSFWQASTRLMEALPPSDPAARPFYEDLTRSFESVRDSGLIEAEPALDRQVAVMERQLAAALQDAGKPAEALPFLDRSVALLRPLPGRMARPEVRAWTEFDLFRGLAQRTSALWKLGRPADALADSEDAIRIIRGLVERFPDDPAWIEARARHLLDRKKLLEDLSRHEDARRELREALGLGRRAVDLAGGEPDVIQVNALNTLLIALTWAATPDEPPSEQERLLREACATADRMHRLAPGAWNVRRASVYAPVFLARFLLEQGRFAEALPMFEELDPAVDRLLASWPDDLMLRSERRTITEGLARCREALKVEPAAPPR